jgi:hypothetical protein
MIAPNKVGDVDSAPASVAQKRKSPKLRYKRPPEPGLDKGVEEKSIVDTLNTQKQGSVWKKSEDDSKFEGKSSAIEAQLQPVPQRQSQTLPNKPLRDEKEERDVAEDEDVVLTAGRQRPRRGRRGEQRLIQLNNVDNIGRTVGQTADLVRNITGSVVGTIADTRRRVLASQPEGNEPLKKEKDEQLRLHMELNLDLEVQLKAKISGDLTLR